MRKMFSVKRFKKSYYDDVEGEVEDEYVELDSDSGSETSSKIVVRPFNLNDFSDIKPILESLRDGYTIALLNIKPLKEKDLVELKRAINKIKKTIDALEGDIAGFGDDYIVAVPSFAHIHRSSSLSQIQED